MKKLVEQCIILICISTERNYYIMLTNGMDTQFNIISYAILSDKYSKGESMLASFVPLFERLLLQIEENTVAITDFAQL